MLALVDWCTIKITGGVSCVKTTNTDDHMIRRTSTTIPYIDIFYCIKVDVHTARSPPPDWQKSAPPVFDRPISPLGEQAAPDTAIPFI